MKGVIVTRQIGNYPFYFIFSVILALIFFVPTISSAQSKIGVGYYDVDKLYDTVPSLHYNDDNYTPKGKYNWNTDRYNQKIANISAVIDSMALPIIGLFGVENENVVRDLVTSCSEDYCYIHRTRNSFDGMDFALLYHADRFFPEEVNSGRDILHVKGETIDSKLSIILTLDIRDLISFDPLIQKDSTAIIVMGRLYHSEIEKIGLIDPLNGASKRGQGNARSSRGWYLHDLIAVNKHVNIDNAGIYINRWLLTPDLLYPKESYTKGRYIGGYSHYLPLYLYFN